MDNVILVNFESDRKVAYYKLNGKIYRRELYDLHEIFKNLNIKNYDDGIKRGLIRECSNNDKELVALQSEFVTQQLNKGVLNGFSSPLDDDIICKEFFNELLKQGEVKKWENLLSWRIRDIRLKKDSKFNNVPLTNGSYSSTQLLSYILNNYDSIVKIFKTNFLKDSIKKLLPYKNDLNFLENFLKVYYSRNEDEIKNNNIINMFNENELEEFINFFGNFLDLQAEHIGSKSITIGGYEARIYLNNHNGNILSQFLSRYAIECLKNGIDYDMKGIYNVAGNGCDGSVLYTEKKDFPKRIQIIESILLEHPEWRVSFSEPIYGTSRFGTGFYGVSHLGGSKERDGKIQIYGNTYNDYFENTCVLSLYCMLAKVLADNNLISSKNETFQLLSDIASFKNITSNESFSLPLNIGINGKKIFTIMEPFTNYFNNPSVMQKIRELGYSVFRDYMYKIHCITQHLPEGTKVDIAINKDMLDFFGKDKLVKKPESPIIEDKSKPVMETKQTINNPSLDNLWQSFNSIRSKLDNPELVNICVSVMRKIMELKKKQIIDNDEQIVELNEILNSFKSYLISKEKNVDWKTTVYLNQIKSKTNNFMSAFDKMNHNQNETLSIVSKDDVSTQYKNEILNRYKNVLKAFEKLKSINPSSHISLFYERQIKSIENQILEKSSNGFTLEERDELIYLIDSMQQVIDSAINTVELNKNSSIPRK